MQVVVDGGWGVAGWGGTLSSGGGEGEAGDGPTVINFEPPEDTPIQPATALAFDVMFTTTIVAITITVFYRHTGVVEEVYNERDGFSANFSPNGLFLGSSRESISGGWHFTIRRRGGWYSAPSIIVRGADENGGRITGAL